MDTNRSRIIALSSPAPYQTPSGPLKKDAWRKYYPKQPSPREAEKETQSVNKLRRRTKRQYDRQYNKTGCSLRCSPNMLLQ